MLHLTQVTQQGQDQMGLVVFGGHQLVLVQKVFMLFMEQVFVVQTQLFKKDIQLDLQFPLKFRKKP